MTRATPALRHAVPVLAAAGVAALLMLERRAALRRPTQAEPSRMLRNLVMGGMSMAVVAAVETPLTRGLAAVVERRRWGLAQRLPGPPALRDAAAVLGLDYTIYLWHVLTHKVPALWRFHLVHHLDLDMDSTTALRFHAADMLVSLPWRLAQVAALGASRRALAAWQAFFFASVLFHHSNLRLPLRLERALARALTTPRMHGIHHSATRDRTDSNWSSGLSLWDHLHGHFRMDAQDGAIPVGVRGYREAAETRLLPSLALPFRRQRDAWAPPPGRARCGTASAPLSDGGRTRISA